MNEAYEKALNYLCKKSRSKKQVVNYLTKYGYEQNEIDACIEKLKEYRFIDDATYANILMIKIKNKDYSLAMAEAYLKKEEIAQIYIEEILKTLGQEYELRSLNNFLLKELRNNKFDNVQINKIKNKALRKGFIDYNIEDVLNNIKERLAEEDQ